MYCVGHTVWHQLSIGSFYSKMIVALLYFCLLEKEDSSSNFYWNCAIHLLVSHYDTFQIMYFKISTAPSTAFGRVLAQVLIERL